MAFNPIMTERSRAEDEKSFAPVKSLPPVIFRKRVKKEYYMEWWELGTPSDHVQSGTFHTANLKHFIKLFASFKKYSLIFLQRLVDGKVLWNRRPR